VPGSGASMLMFSGPRPLVSSMSRLGLAPFPGSSLANQTGVLFLKWQSRDVADAIVLRHESHVQVLVVGGVVPDQVHVDRVFGTTSNSTREDAVSPLWMPPTFHTVSFTT